MYSYMLYTYDLHHDFGRSLTVEKSNFPANFFTIQTLFTSAIKMLNCLKQHGTLYFFREMKINRHFSFSFFMLVCLCLNYLLWS